MYGQCNQILPFSLIVQLFHKNMINLIEFHNCRSRKRFVKKITQTQIKWFHLVRSIWVTKMSLNWVSLVSISVVCDCAQCVNAWIFVLLLSFVSTTRIYFHNTIYPHLFWVYGLFNWPQNQKSTLCFLLFILLTVILKEKKRFRCSWIKFSWKKNLSKY